MTVQVISRLGDELVSRGIITPEQLEKACEQQKLHGGRLGKCITKLGFATEEEVSAVLSDRYGVAALNLIETIPTAEALALIPREAAVRYQAVPIRKQNNTLIVALADPASVQTLDELRFLTGLSISPRVSVESQVQWAIEQYYGNGLQTVGASEMLQSIGDAVESEFATVVSHDSDQEEINAASLLRESESAPVIRLVNWIFYEAVRRKASDIHIEPYEQEIRVRFRIDGNMKTIMRPSCAFRDSVTSRIKVMASLNISEKRLPQDGRLKITLNVSEQRRELDVRVSTLPVLFGEKIVMRLLDRNQLALDMSRLGFQGDALRRMEAGIAKPYGMILVTGPTGSGKTSTLYSAIARLNKPDVNIMTAEDPVEFNLPGINQVQTKEQIGLTFAAALRSFLRQDPNIILVGEIRDSETAEIAIKAALTGHLVLSTLHTNDSASTITRLVDIGVDRFLVGTSINVICAQRLVRRLCLNCREEVQLPQKALVDFGFTPEEAATSKIYKGKGCTQCGDSGFDGRVGLYEVMEMNDEIRSLIMAGATSVEIKHKAIELGMETIRRNGIRKIIQGITSTEEVLRETVL